MTGGGIKLSSILTIPSYFVNRKNTNRHPYESFLRLKHAVYLFSYNKQYNALNFIVYSEENFGSHYYTSISLMDKNSDMLTKPNQKLKVYCSCPDFRYTFAYVLHNKLNSILYHELFLSPFLNIPPKKKNPHQIPWVCKHVYTITNLVYLKNRVLKFNNDTVKRFNVYLSNKIRNNLIPRQTYYDYEILNFISKPNIFPKHELLRKIPNSEIIVTDINKLNFIKSYFV